MKIKIYISMIECCIDVSGLIHKGIVILLCNLLQMFIFILQLCSSGAVQKSCCKPVPMLLRYENFLGVKLYFRFCLTCDFCMLMNAQGVHDIDQEYCEEKYEKNVWAKTPSSKSQNLYKTAFTHGYKRLFRETKPKRILLMRWSNRLPRDVKRQEEKTTLFYIHFAYNIAMNYQTIFKGSNLIFKWSKDALSYVFFL